ncbi:MAG: aldehyde ferredoxin oxidoreductase family protein [Methanomicrobiales archaeon]|nr:aldehyde ferredoxin oxidoreductase family protein [Methanomicrobiales archaeon]
MQGGGAFGSVLDVDLGGHTIAESGLSRAIRRGFLGGRGVGVRIATRGLDPAIDPLRPENILVFSAGLLTGTGVPLGSRLDVVTKSPLTGTLTSSNMGGQFGAALRRAGTDTIVLRGASASPVLLRIDEAGAELHDASDYWGMGTAEVTEAIRRDTGDRNARVACIGPAGERQALISCIIDEKARAAGRGGVGAVMGAKRLKAIVVTGRRRERSWDEEGAARVREFVREKVEKSGIARGGLHRYGTATLVNLINEKELLPTRNFQHSRFEGAEMVSGEEMERTILRGRKGCYACPVACGRVTSTNGHDGEGPEYETIWAFGPACGVNDLKAIARANYLCNELGLDTISTGATIACAMEMAERGHISNPFRFGDAGVLEPLVRMIAFGEGIGAELAEGSLRFARRYGHPELSMSVKGQEIPAYDPRGLQGQGLEYATSVRGACHVYGNMVYPEVLGIPVRLDPLSLEGKAYWTKYMQDISACIDSLGMCLFTIRTFHAKDYAYMASELLGEEIDEAEFLRIGERIWNLQRLFNLGAGLEMKDDTLPDRLLSKEGAGAGGKGWRRDPLLSEYYRERGWDEQGIPTGRTRERLGIGADAGIEEGSRYGGDD